MVVLLCVVVEIVVLVTDVDVSVRVVVVIVRIGTSRSPLSATLRGTRTYNTHTAGFQKNLAYGGRKECPDVGFQKRGSGKEACALLAKLVT